MGIVNPFKLIYTKLFQINDSPQKIALGLGLGVFLGLIPGTGPIAAITLAIVFRVNRFSALLGSLATNTWLSVLLLIPATKLGARVLGLKWLEVYGDWLKFLDNFRWSALLEISIYKLILPVIVGYVTMGLLLAVSVYVITVSILMYKKYAKQN